MNEVAADSTRKPTHRAYFVKGEGETARWLELGTVWTHKDAKGFDVLLDTLPVGGFSGRITVRANETKP
jgi:hypothetical protein